MCIPIHRQKLKKSKELPVNLKPYCHIHKKSPRHTHTHTHTQHTMKKTVSETNNHSNAHTHTRKHTHTQRQKYIKYQRGVKQTKVKTLKEKRKITSI